MGKFQELKMRITEKLKSLKSRIRYPSEFLKFKRCGRNLWLGSKGCIARPEEVSFGDNVFINKGFHISARNLTFGNDIMIGPNLVIECDDHVFNEVGVTMFENRNQRKIGSVTIENDVWMGANVTVLKGVVIGEGSVVGAHSVVTKNIPPYTVCVGAPCRPVKTRFPSDRLEDHLRLVGSNHAPEVILTSWEEAGF